VGSRIRSQRVIEVLSKLVSARGAPRYLRSDNGPEFVSCAILMWLTEAKIDTALIDPGKPWQNSANESFNGKFRDECLGMQWFRNRTDARVLIETWRREAPWQSAVPVAKHRAQLAQAASREGRRELTRFTLPSRLNSDPFHSAGRASLWWMSYAMTS
jgi:putative transposase